MSLGETDRTLLRLSTAVVLADWDEVRRLRREACPDGPDRAWRECVLQTHLFAGFPRLVEAFGVLEEVGGVGVPDAGEVEGERELDGSSREDRGGQLFELIYGAEAPGLRTTLSGFHADVGDWILQHAYGRVLSRPGLSSARRELLAACALAALGQDRQLASHARGSLRCGATFEELMHAFDCVRDLIGEEKRDRARRIAERFRSNSC